jgi:chromate reductase, NAD(P)H dehydrogenase (quinone)
MTDLTLLGMCGSLRRGSFNRKLMLEAVRSFAPARFIDGDLRLPLYDGDMEREHGIPDKVQLLADQIAKADAVIIACPEYNKALSGVMKNALDWISRVKADQWRDKPVAIMSAAAGRAGGERSQSSLRLCLNPFRPLVLPGPEVLVGNAKEHFDESGALVTESYRSRLDELMRDLRRIATPERVH